MRTTTSTNTVPMIPAVDSHYHKNDIVKTSTTNTLEMEDFRQVWQNYPPNQASAYGLNITLVPLSHWKSAKGGREKFIPT